VTDAPPSEPGLPREPIDRVLDPFQRFLHVEAASGVVLLAATIAALVLANSGAAEGFLAVWKAPIGLRAGALEIEHSLKHWINDGLMAVFFFVIGLEVKREIVLGELRGLRQAALPIAAAIGGMVVPAAVYLLLQGDGPARAGWGIPMATDIAFVVGCMAVLGRRVPHRLRVLLLSLAIADDIGAILVIAIGYTDSIDAVALAWGFGGIALVVVLQRLGVRSIAAYTVAGAGTWFAFHESGVHATVAGVVLGLQTPARSYLSPIAFGGVIRRAGADLEADEGPGAHRAGRVRELSRAARERVSPLEYLESTLHPWVAFGILPLFALANAGVPFRLADLGDPIALAVAAGLLVGKPVGIVAASFAAVKLGLARKPAEVSWATLTGAGLLAGIGFTMALFVSGLALTGPELDVAKVGVLAASAVAAAAGMGLLVATLPRPAPA